MTVSDDVSAAVSTTAAVLLVLVCLAESVLPINAQHNAKSTATNAGALAKSSGVQEFCQWQTFNGSCPADSVIIIEHALYGRMRLNRCLDRDFGFLSCSVSVMNYMEQRCSGRQRCQISLPDAYLDNLPRPCPADLKAYLELSYHCLEVETGLDQSCRASADQVGIKITKPSGYLSNFITAETNKGSSSCPWILEGQPGQRFTLSLIDYGTTSGDDRPEPAPVGWIPHSSGRDSSVNSNSGQSGTGSGGPLCHIYAQIREANTDTGHNVVACNDSPKQHEQIYYTSESNIVKVELINVKAAANPTYFLLKYEATGCVDFVPPAGATFTRNADRVLVYCVGAEDQTWELRCETSRWIGRTYNCSDLDLGRGSFWNLDGIITGARIPSRNAVVIVIIGIAALVSLFILIIGILAIRRRRCNSRRQQGLSFTSDPLRSGLAIDSDGGGRYKTQNTQYPLLLKPETGVYPSSRYHHHHSRNGGGEGGAYTATSGCQNQTVTSHGATAGNMFVSDFYTGYTSVDCPLPPSIIGGAGGTYPLPTASGVAVYPYSAGSDVTSSPRRFYNSGTVVEHIYESPKFDRKSLDYDDVDDMRFQQQQQQQLQQQQQQQLVSGKLGRMASLTQDFTMP